MYGNNIAQVGAVAIAAGQSLAAASIPVCLPQDGIQGSMNTIAVTLSGTITTVTTVTLPNTAQGIRLYPRISPILFAFGTDTVIAQATGGPGAVAAATFSVGNVAKNDTWEVRNIAPGSSRTLHLLPTVAGSVVDVECF
jgi:hypothetical protein